MFNLRFAHVQVLPDNFSEYSILPFFLFVKIMTFLKLYFKNILSSQQKHLNSESLSLSTHNQTKWIEAP